MKIEVDTEIEEISELKAAIAILEDVIKRRECPEEEQEESQDYQQATENFIQKQPEPTQQSSFEQPQEETKPQPEVDMSALSMSDYGEKKENRSLETVPQDKKSIIKDIITNLAQNNPNQPIQMNDIIQKASEKNIPEDSTRNLIDELKNSGEI